jgi:hypothetical protein
MTVGSHSHGRLRISFRKSKPWGNFLIIRTPKAVSSMLFGVRNSDLTIRFIAIALAIF